MRGAGLWSFVTASTVFLLLSWNSFHYWDEFFYLFAALAHSPRELVRLDALATLGPSGFPTGYFTSKIGHVVLLRLLTQVFGTGETALYLIQAIFALLLVGFGAVAYGLLRELLDDAQRARDAAIVLLFLPGTMYLAYKTLSEVPSLLLITLGCWGFLRSFRAASRNRIGALLGLSAVALSLGTLCRVTAFVSFVGLVLALLVAGDVRFPRRAVLIRVAAVGGSTLLLVTLSLRLLGGSEFLPLGLAYQVATRPDAGLQRVYALALFLQTFALVLLFVPYRPWNIGIRLAMVWSVATALPFLAGHESRYYAPMLIPLALLAATGLRRMAGLLLGPGHRWGWIAVLAALVLVNRFLLLPLVVYDIDQSRLLSLMDRLTHGSSQATYLLPWSSDYSLLRFAFPDQRIRLCLSETPESRYQALGRPGPLGPLDQWWSGPDHYVGSLAALTSLPRPWYYVGWTYLPTTLRLRDLLRRLGIHLLDDPTRLGFHNHLAGSWIWDDPALTLQPLGQEGQFHLYRVLLRARPYDPGG